MSLWVPRQSGLYPTDGRQIAPSFLELPTLLRAVSGTDEQDLYSPRARHLPCPRPIVSVAGPVREARRGVDKERAGRDHRLDLGDESFDNQPLERIRDLPLSPDTQQYIHKKAGGSTFHYTYSQVWI